MRIVPAVLTIALALLLAGGGFAFWSRYVRAAVSGFDALPIAMYTPSVRVAGSNAPPPPRLTPEDAGIDRFALDEASDYAMQGGATTLLVARNGHLVHERYAGGATFDTEVDADAVARVVVLLALGAALEDRSIPSLDWPVSKFVAEWREDARGLITLRQLADMTSGLAPESRSNAPWSPSIRERFGTQFRRRLLERPDVSTGGTAVVDKPIDAELLAFSIERGAKRPYADYLSERVWKRIGAADARLWLDREGGSPRAACCFAVRQGDLLRVGEVLARDGVYQGEEITPPGWVRDLRRRVNRESAFGRHVRLSDDRFDSPDLFYVAGHGGLRLWIVPSLALVILRTGGAEPEAGTKDDAMIPNLIVRGMGRSAPKGPGSSTDPSTLVPGH